MFKDNDKKLIPKLPFGFRDIFPVEAQERRSIEEIVRETFLLWGYGEVKTPVVEFTKNISAGVGKDWKDRLISFFDNDGNLVSLRADMTIPIARLTGMRIKKEQLPARFFYLANSFRQSGLQKGQKRVLSQAGLELIGSEEFYADVEVLIILINILEKLEVRDFKIGVGHIKLIEGIYDWFGLSVEEYDLFKDYLISNNRVALKELLLEKDKKKAQVFLELIEPSDKIAYLENLIKEVKNKKILESFKYLQKVFEALYGSGFNRYLIADLGIIRDFDYYSGLVFEIYSPEITEKLGSGGRYDGLIKKFGFDVGATGFALDVDLVHKSVREDKLEKFRFRSAIILFGSESDYLYNLKFAQKLRSHGISVALINKKDVVIEQIAASRRVEYVYEVNRAAGKVLKLEISSGNKELQDIKDY